MSRWGNEGDDNGNEEKVGMPILPPKVLKAEREPLFFAEDAISSNLVSAGLSQRGCKSPLNHHVNGDGRVVCDADPNKKLCFFYNRIQNRAGSNKECQISLPDRVFDEIARSA